MTPNYDPNYQHVVPVNDRIEHLCSGFECECSPRLDPEHRLIIHNALDNREFDEIAAEINE